MGACGPRVSTGRSVERLQQRPIAKIDGLGEEKESKWVEFGCPYA